MPAKVSIDAAVSEINSVICTFAETMKTNFTDSANTTTSMGPWIQPNTLPPTDSRRGSPMQVPFLHKSPIPTAAVQSAISSSTLSRPTKVNDVQAGPSPTCTALVPSRLYEHQYLGWPTRRTAEAIVYRDKTWPVLGACILQFAGRAGM
jgi:hypothetical protein